MCVAVQVVLVFPVDVRFVLHAGFFFCFSDNASACIPGSVVFLFTIFVDGIPGHPPSRDRVWMHLTVVMLVRVRLIFWPCLTMMLSPLD